MDRRGHARDRPGHQPGQRRADRHRADVRRRRDAARHCRSRSRAARLGPAPGQGAHRDPAPAQRPDAGQPGRPGAHHDHRAGQAAGREQGRDRLCGLLHRLVRRRGAARLRRHHPRALGRPPHPRAQAADRRDGGDHALELPDRHAHAQGRPGTGRRLRDGGQARHADAVLGAGLRGAGPARRAAQGPACRCSPARPRRSAAR